MSNYDKIDCSPDTLENENNPEQRTWKETIDFIKNAELKEEIAKRVNDPENYLGEGGAAMVFDIGEGQCVKLIKNRHNSPNAHMYDLGNHPEDEVRIQNTLKNFKVAGVFVPTIFSEYHSIGTSAILMEKLDAVNLQLVLNEEEKMPENFSLNNFFDNLKKFINAMHDEKNVAHADLDPRNVMIDKKTGEPRIIDFGRSKIKDEVENIEYAKKTKKDNDDLQKIYDKLMGYLKKTTN